MKPFLANIVSLGGADIAGRLLNFLAVTYLARTLGPGAMGILAIGMAVLAYAAIFADAGLPILGTREAATGQQSVRYLVRRVFSSRLILSFTVIILGVFLITILIEDTKIKIVTNLFFLSLLPGALLLEWLFQGLHRMTILAVGRIFGMVVYLVSIIAFVSNSNDLYKIPIAWCIGIVVQTLFLWSRYRVLHSDKDSDDKPLHIFRLIKQGIPLGIATLISQLVIQFPFIYLGFFDTAEKTGLYSIAFRVVTLMLVIDRVFYTIFFPVISRSFNKDPDNLEKQVNRVLKFVTSITLYVCIIALIAGKSVFPFIFGVQFTESSIIFQSLLAYYVLTIINSVFTFTLIGIGQERLYTRSLLAGGFAFIIIILLPIPVESTLLIPLALSLFQAVSMFQMIRHLRNTIYINLLRRVLIPLVVTIAIIYVYSYLYHIAFVVVSIVVICVSLPIIGYIVGINREDMEYAKKILV